MSKSKVVWRVCVGIVNIAIVVAVLNAASWKVTASLDSLGWVYQERSL